MRRWSRGTPPPPASRPSSSRAAGSSRAGTRPPRCRTRSPTSPETRHRPRRPELHGRHGPDRQQRRVHRRRVAVPAARRCRRDRPVGIRHGRVHPVGIARRLQPHHQLRLRGRPGRLRLPRLLPGRSRDDLGHPVPRGLQAAGALPRPGRSGARARQADHGGQGGSKRPGAGRGGRPLRLARRRDARHGRRPRRRRRHPLSRPRRVARDGRAGRGHPPDRTRRRPRADRRRHRVAPARRRSWPTSRHGRGSTCRRSPTRREPRSSSVCPRWATSATRSIRGAPPTPRPPTAPCFEAMAASDAYDVLVLVHDFPYRSMPAEVATANDVTLQLLDATRDRPHILPVYVSLTSGEPPPETKALLDDQGGGAPLLRGARRGFQRDRIGGPLGAAPRGAGSPDGPWRPSWPALAADRTLYGLDDAVGRRGRAPPEPVRCPNARASSCCATAGLAVTEAIAVPDAEAAVEAARRSAGDPSRSSSTRRTWPTRAISASSARTLGDDAVRAAGRRAPCYRPRRPRARARPARRADGPRGRRADRRAAPRPSFGPAVVVGLGGVLTEVLDDVAIRLAPSTTTRPSGCSTGCAARGSSTACAASARRSRCGRRPHRGARPASATTRPDILEVDLNPVIASAGGAVAVDALVVLASTRRAEPETRTDA